MNKNKTVVFLLIVMGSLVVAVAGYLFSFFALFSLGFFVCCGLVTQGAYLIVYGGSILLEDLEEKEKEATREKGAGKER